MSKKPPPEQLYLADDLQPPPDPERDPDLDEIVFAWLDARDEQRKTADATKIKHEVLLAALAAREMDRYPYLDRFTGKKRYVTVEREPKVKITKPFSPGKPKRAAKEREVTETSGDTAGAVEHRKVSRKSVEKEIDPFASTRANMKPEGILDQSRRLQSDASEP